MITTLDPETEARIRRLSSALCDQLCALRAAGAHHRIPGVVQEAMRKVHQDVVESIAAQLEARDPRDPSPDRWPCCSQKNCDLPALWSYTWNGEKMYGCAAHTAQAIDVSKAIGFNEPGRTLQLVVDENVKV